MEILEPFENAAHVTVRVVDRSHGLLDGFESMLRKLDDLRSMSFS